MRRRLYRSRDEQMLFGVAGGMAEWLDLDPSLVRLVWVLLMLAGGVGLVLYIVAALIIPEAPLAAAPANAASPAPGASAPVVQTREEAREAQRAARREARRLGNGNAGLLFGLVLVLVGGLFLAQRLLPAFDTGWISSGVLIIIGLALVVIAVVRSRTPG